MAVAASWWIPLNCGRPGGRDESLDSESLALLAGGPQRQPIRSLPISMPKAGWPMPGMATLSVVNSAIPASVAGKAVLALESPFKVNAARAALAVHAERVTARLRRQGLVAFAEGGQTGCAGWRSRPLACCYVTGLYRQRAGSALDEPTGGWWGC